MGNRRTNKGKKQSGKSPRKLRPGEYPKGNVAHTRGWEPGDPIRDPSTLLVDGIEQTKPPELEEHLDASAKNASEIPHYRIPSGSPASFGISYKPPQIEIDYKALSGRKLKAVEIVGLIVAIAIPVVGFILSAPSAAGVTGVLEARELLVAAWVFTVGGGFFVEWLAGRSRRRITLTILSSAIIMACCLLFIDNRIAGKKRQQEASALSQPSTTLSNAEDLRSDLRADGNRAIHIFTAAIRLKRKYSIEEIGHFRVMYEVAAITNKIVPEFYLGAQDYYAKNGVNPSIDPNVNQFGYRWTAQSRQANGQYKTLSAFSRNPRKYGAVTEASRYTDQLEFSWDVYNQVPSDKTLEDLFGKDLYIFITESLADKISEVSFQVNNWQLFSVKADRLIFPNDKPIAPWFMVLSKQEQSVAWKGIYLRNDERMPPQVVSRFEGNPGWVWSLDPGTLHPKKIPEPELKVDPLKPD